MALDIPLRTPPRRPKRRKVFRAPGRHRPHRRQIKVRRPQVLEFGASATLEGQLEALACAAQDIIDAAPRSARARQVARPLLRQIEQLVAELSRQRLGRQKLFAVGKQTGYSWGISPWQACLTVAESAEQAIEHADQHFGTGWWQDHPDEPTVVLYALAVRVKAGVPPTITMSGSACRLVFPPGVPTKVPTII